MDITALKSYFNNYLPLDSATHDYLSQCVQSKEIKRRQLILKEGEICKYYSFIIQGCFKLYALDDKGDAHIIQFAAENDWVTDIGSFHEEKPSFMTIEALEPSIVLQIAKPDMLHLFTISPAFDRSFRVIIENKYVALQQHLLKNISLTALARYQSFLADYPELALRLPNTQIASYLGITPEFLSKLRQNKTKK